MGEGWILGTPCFKKGIVGWTILLVFIFLASCTPLPRVVVLHDPLSGEEHMSLGMSYELEGEFDHAMKEYEKARKLMSNDYRPLFYLGNIYYKKGDYSRAEKLYREAFELNPESGDILNNLAWVYIDRKELEKAQVEIERAISIKKNPYYLDTLANIYNEMERYDEALEILEDAIAITPSDNTELLYVEYSLAGDIYEKMGMHSKAQEARKKAEEVEGRR